MLKFKEYFLKETRKVSGYSYGPERENEQYHIFYENHVWIKMSPDKLLELASTMSDEDIRGGEKYHKKSFKYNKNKIVTNDVNTPIHLYIDVNLGVLSHEGRHRSVVLKRLGIKEIPVKVFYHVRFRDELISKKNEVFNSYFIPELRHSTNMKISSQSIYPKNIKKFEDFLIQLLNLYPWLEYEFKENRGSYYFYPKYDLKIDEPIIKVILTNNMFTIVDINERRYFANNFDNAIKKFAIAAKNLENKYNIK